MLVMRAIIGRCSHVYFIPACSSLPIIYFPDALCVNGYLRTTVKNMSIIPYTMDGYPGRVASPGLLAQYVYHVVALLQLGYATKHVSYED